MEKNFNTLQELADFVKSYHYKDALAERQRNMWKKDKVVRTLSDGVDEVREDLKLMSFKKLYNIRLILHEGKTPQWEIKYLYDNCGKKFVAAIPRSGGCYFFPYKYDDEVWNKIIDDIDKKIKKN